MEVFSDSRLVVGQTKGELEARDPRMQGYLNQVRRMQMKFESFDLTHVPRGENSHADSLATLATSSVLDFPRVIIIEDLRTPSSPENEVCQVYQISSAPSWMDPVSNIWKVTSCLKKKQRLRKYAGKLIVFGCQRTRSYTDGLFSGPYLLCVHPNATESILEELHESICESHTGGRSLSHRAITQGYWWLSMQKEAQEYIRKCDQC